MTDASALAELRVRGPDRGAEIALLGEWLLARAGLGAEIGEVTVAPGGVRDSLVLQGGHLSGVAHRVPWARDAARIAVLVDGRTLVVDRSAVTINAHTNLAGDARDDVVFDAVAGAVGPRVWTATNSSCAAH